MCGNIELSRVFMRGVGYATHFFIIMRERVTFISIKLTEVGR